MPRMFFAIPIAASLHDVIVPIISSLKKQHELSEVRWSPPENWHITVRFLGELPIEKMDSCIAQGEQILRSISPFEITLGELIPFPTHHPRLLVIQVPLSIQLAKLHQVLEEKMLGLGFKPDTHDFYPHITLGKLPKHFTTLNYLPFFASQIQQVKKVTLFESSRERERSVYKPIHQFILREDFRTG